MDFESAKKEAEIWTQNKDVPFQLVGAIDEEMRLIFEAKRLTRVVSRDASVNAPVSTVPDEEEASSSLIDETVVLRPCSFYVICPSCGGSGDAAEANDLQPLSWHVWSDDANILPKLTAVQDFIHTCREKKLTEILDKVFISLKKYMSTPPGAAVHPSEDDDEDDPGFDDDADAEAMSDDDDELPVEDDAGEGMQILPKPPGSAGNDETSFFVGHASKMSVHRILKDLKQLQEDACKDYGIQGAPRGDNMFVWDVKLSNFPSDSLLGQDLEKYAQKYNREPVITLEMRFPDDYPMAPPFVRVIRPKFHFQTGHITIGGSICMEMLTTSGWRPTNDIEGILVQIRAEIMSDSNTRLDLNQPDREYSEVEARQAFQRMVHRYGWK